jgi:hypothetical protein
MSRPRKPLPELRRQRHVRASDAEWTLILASARRRYPERTDGDAVRRLLLAAAEMAG